MTTQTAKSTKDRILDAAEALFAEHGYDGTSLRGVTGQAGVNLAAVHYHFGSKAALFEAVFRRRVEDVNAERLSKLDELEARGPEHPPSLEEVLEAFLGPVLRLSARRDDEGWRRFMQLVGRCNSVSGEHMEPLRQVFQQVAARFFPAFLRAVPHLREKDLYYRLHFLIGSMSTLIADPLRIQIHSEGLCRSDDPDEVLRHLVIYAAEGFRAPTPVR